MKRYGIFTAMMLLISSTFATYGMAQNNEKTTDFCQQHANLWDSEGKTTVEGHQKLYLQEPGWWFDSKNNIWREWPSEKTHWSLQEHQNLNTHGPDWWFDSENNEWKEWPTHQQESLECHKKIYLSGPQWWFDSENKEWKRWPK